MESQKLRYDRATITFTTLLLCLWSHSNLQKCSACFIWWDKKCEPYAINTGKKKEKNNNDFKVLEPCKAISNELKTAQQIIASELEEHFESLLVQIPHFAHEVMNLP